MAAMVTASISSQARHRSGPCITERRASSRPCAERAWLASAVNARYGGAASTPEPATISRLLTEEQRQGARAVGLAIRLACDLSGRSAQLLVNARATVKSGALVLSAAAGYADVLLGEQTRRRGKALAEVMGLKLEIDGQS